LPAHREALRALALELIESYLAAEPASSSLAAKRSVQQGQLGELGRGD